MATPESFLERPRSLTAKQVGNLLEKIVDSSIDGILAFDLRCRYTTWNPSMEKISGKTKDECLGRVAFDVFPFLRITGEDKYFLQALQGEIVKVTDRPYIVPETGREGFYEAVYTPIYSEENQIIGGTAVVRDITEAKVRQAELKESEMRYRAITQFARDAIIACDSSGKILAWNEGATNVFDYENDQIVGRNLGLIIPEEFWMAYIREVQNFLPAGKTLEVYGYRKHGSSLPIEITLSVWKSDVNIYLSVVARDISDRRRLEMREEERQEGYEALLQAQSDLGEGVAMLDASNGRIHYVNEAVVRLTGYSKEELLTMEDPYKLIPNDLLPLMKRRLLIKNGHGEYSDNFETLCLKKDGTVMNVDVSIKSVETSHGSSMAVLVRDISDRKRTESALRESEATNRKLIELARDTIITMFVDGTITMISPAFTVLTGWTSSEWLGKNLTSLIHPDDLGVMRTFFATVFEGKTPPIHGLRIATKSGEYISMENAATPLFQQGRVTGSLCFLRDISERQRQERAIQQEQVRFRVLAEAAHSGICITEDGRIIEANYAFAKLFGYEFEEVIGMSPGFFSTPGDRDLVLSFVFQGYENPYQFTALRKDGSTFKAEVRGKNFTVHGRNLRLASIREVSS